MQDMIAEVALEHLILDHPFRYIVLDGLENLKKTDVERARPLPLEKSLRSPWIGPRQHPCSTSSTALTSIGQICGCSRRQGRK